MTPKERAESLFITFRSQLKGDWSDNIDIILSKECALIAVDEIITILELINYHPEYVSFSQKNEDDECMNGYEMVDYYEQVKEEIKNK
jgi:hypothetical protein